MAIILAGFPCRGVVIPCGMPGGTGRSANTDGNSPSSNVATVYRWLPNDAGSGCSAAICKDKVAGTGSIRVKGEEVSSTVLFIPGPAMVSSVPANSIRIPSRFRTMGWLLLGTNIGYKGNGATSQAYWFDDTPTVSGQQ